MKVVDQLSHWEAQGAWAGFGSQNIESMTEKAGEVIETLFTCIVDWTYAVCVGVGKKLIRRYVMLHFTRCWPFYRHAGFEALSWFVAHFATPMDLCLRNVLMSR